MGLIKISGTSSEDLFKTSFPVLPAGKHVFVVANDLEVTQTSGGSPKDMVKLEARCQDEDGNKGMVVFDNFLIITTPVDEKEAKAKQIHDARFAQFTVACGVKTKEQIENGEDIDLSEFKDKVFQAQSKVVQENVYPEELDDNGKPKKEPRARIARYLFEPTVA